MVEGDAGAGNAGSDNRRFDAKAFNALSSTLQLPAEMISKPAPPASVYDGKVHGFLMHQGKFRGAWKKGWFVLKPPFLFQYADVSV